MFRQGSEQVKITRARRRCLATICSSLSLFIFWTGTGPAVLGWRATQDTWHGPSREISIVAYVPAGLVALHFFVIGSR